MKQVGGTNSHSTYDQVPRAGPMAIPAAIAASPTTTLATLPAAVTAKRAAPSGPSQRSSVLETADASPPTSRHAAPCPPASCSTVTAA
jgi:hypothetical protein